MSDQQPRPLKLDERTLRLVEEKFAYKKQLAAGKERELFGIFEAPLTEEETLCLKYLYAYMPLNDMADYDGSLFLNHVRQSLRIRRSVPWGERVPDSLFFYFVLPYRVNNENIEDYLTPLFAELYPRVADKSMYDAILETNYWCHEKANYIGNDRRTVSPLTLIRTTLGRCGEQSTLAVAALRSIGIPARQCYTPLWAHCDSNHAWVEAWADGKWYFLGACEPEPRLNQGWFRQPARRAMLVHTRLAANYAGPEEVTLERPWYSELNLLSNYAHAKKLRVRVVDEQGRPAQAKVEFQLYNYAAFSTIVPMETDETGQVSISLGLGDIFICASGKDGWGYAHCRVAETEEATVTLSKRVETDGTLDFDMVPPPELPDFAGEPVSEAERERHQARVKEGAQIRADFEATFLQETDAAALAASLGLPADRVWEVLKKARGNSHEIAAFLREQTPVYGEWSLRLLESLNDKDLTDTFRPTLEDHLAGAVEFKDTADEQTFVSYLLRPRVDFEMITPYRAFFLEQLSAAGGVETYRENPWKLAAHIADRIQVMDDLTYYKGSATPVGTYRLGLGDRLSRDILFVAAARSAGIPARLEPTDKRPQFWHSDAWHDVVFPTAGAAGTLSVQASPAELEVAGTATVDAQQDTIKAQTSVQTGRIRWLEDAESDEQAQYFGNFSLARFENGVYQTLHYRFGKTDVFAEPFEVPAGAYRLTTGVRLADGTALVRFRFFQVEAGKQADIPIEFRKPAAEIPVLGEADLAFPLETLDNRTFPAQERKGEHGLLLAWIEPDREPSKHLLRELTERREDWNKLGVPILVIVPEDKLNAAFTPEAYPLLPELAAFAKDPAASDGLSRVQAGMEEDASGRTQRSFPVIVALDRENRIRYYSSGYKLGLSQDVLKVYRGLTRT
jgi:transglutaminase-like putative cysteine protease